MAIVDSSASLNKTAQNQLHATLIHSFEESPTGHYTKIETLYTSDAPLSLSSERARFFSEAEPNEKAKIVLEMLDCLCARGPLPAKEGKKYLSALLWKKDPEMLAYFFDALQLELNHIYILASEGKLDPEIAQLRINNMLNYIAFTEPDLIQRNSIKVPVLKSKPSQWSFETYDIEALELTPKWMRFLGSPYYAYGLKPRNKHNIPSQLLFMGTTYPAARGSLWTYVFDLIPGISVGGMLFRLAKKKIGDWINKQERQTLCHGQSLGGSMSIFTAEAFEAKTKAYAHVPAGQLSYTHPTFSGENVTVYMQGFDPIAKMGWLPPNANYFYVLPNAETNEKEPSYATKPGIIARLFSHAASLIGHPKSILLKVTPEWQSEQKSRPLWTALLVLVSLSSILLLTLMVALNGIIRTLLSPFYGFYQKNPQYNVPTVFSDTVFDSQAQDINYSTPITPRATHEKNPEFMQIAGLEPKTSENTSKTLNTSPKNRNNS